MSPLLLLLLPLLKCFYLRQDGAYEWNEGSEDGLPSGVHPQVPPVEARQVGKDGREWRAEELHQQLYREIRASGKTLIRVVTSWSICNVERIMWRRIEDSIFDRSHTAVQLLLVEEFCCWRLIWWKSVTLNRSLGALLITPVIVPSWFLGFWTHSILSRCIARNMIGWHYYMRKW